MDPLTALALSGNVLQFIDSACKLISEARQVCHAVNGITAANRDAIAVYDDFQAAAAALSARPLHPRTADDAAVVALAERCQEVSDDLVRGLKNLQATNPGSKRDSLRVAWRALRDKGELESLEKRLDRYRQQLVTRITFMMSQDQSSTYRLLQECKWQDEDSATKTRDHLQALSQELLGLSQKVEQSSHATTSSINGLQDQGDATVQKMTDLIADITATKEKVEKERQILNKLKFPGMRRRENAIERARAGTYRWLLYPPSAKATDEVTNGMTNGATDETIGEAADESSNSSRRSSVVAVSRDGNKSDDSYDVFEALMQLRKLALKNAHSFDEDEGSESSQLKKATRARFLSWVESGSGIFYFSGKPGSGKSTIMKFLTREQRTIEGLKTWAAGKQLVSASFFFWSSGLGLQRSIEGLYRGLLWETLRTCPDLMPMVFPREWHNDSDDSEFLLSEIEEAFARLIRLSSTLADHRICFFIDGLDEFEGDHLRLAKLLKEWASSPNIKICVASRPYSDFENTFATQPEQRLRLHEHTAQDMIQAAQDELKSAERHSWESDGQDYTLLIKSAVKKANGVFLWLRLAMRHLVRGIGSAYSVPQLAEMLHSMPEDVSVMFQTMLDKLLARPDRVRVAITLLSLSDPSLPSGYHRNVAFFSAMDDVLDVSIKLDDLLGTGGSLGDGYSQDQIQRRLITTEARLRGRCEDFIDIHDSPNKEIPFPLRRRIEFVHRDLRDFLVQDQIVQRLHDVAGWSSSKIAGLHRYLGIVLLRTMPAIARAQNLVDQLADEFYNSESTTAPELELLLFHIIKNSNNDSTVEGRSLRYCTILAIQDNILNQQIEKKVIYTKAKPAQPLTLALQFVSAAAFHRHDDYVLRLVTRFPILLELEANVNILLSATLGGAAAHAIASPHPNQPRPFLDPTPRKGFLKSIIGSDHAINPGGVGALLYPQTPTELFPSPSFETADLDNTDPSTPTRPLRTGPSPPLTLTRALLEKGAPPNLPLHTLPTWPGARTGWTPWTATLLALAGVLRRGEMLDETLLEVMELYLRHGADATVCFVGRYIPKRKLKPVPVFRVGPGVYASLKLEAHVPTLFTDGDGAGGDGEGGGGGWWYLTLGQVVQLARDGERKRAVADLVYAKSPWKVSRWVGQAAARWKGAGVDGAAGGKGNGIMKLELERLGDCYFFVSMIVREQEIGGLVVPEEAKRRLLPASLILI